MVTPSPGWGTRAEVMPLRSSSKDCPGDCLEVEVVEPNAGRAPVVGKLDAMSQVAGRQRIGRRGVTTNSLAATRECRGRKGVRSSSAREGGRPGADATEPTSVSGATEPTSVSARRDSAQRRDSAHLAGGRAGGVLHVKPVRVGSPTAYAPLHSFCGYECATADRLQPDGGRELVVGPPDSVPTAAGRARTSDRGVRRAGQGLRRPGDCRSGAVALPGAEPAAGRF